VNSSATEPSEDSPSDGYAFVPLRWPAPGNRPPAGALLGVDGGYGAAAVPRAFPAIADATAAHGDSWGATDDHAAAPGPVTPAPGCPR
jgi:hypothetical protein